MEVYQRSYCCPVATVTMYELFTEGNSDLSIKQKRKYAVLPNFGAESDFAAMDNN